MGASWEQRGSNFGLHCELHCELHYELHYGFSMNYTNARKQIKQVVVKLAQVNKRFNPVKVLPKADHC